MSDVGRWLDKACDLLLAGEPVPFPDGRVARRVGEPETCKECNGTGKDPDPMSGYLTSPPSYGRDGCDTCRARGKTFRYEIT